MYNGKGAWLTLIDHSLQDKESLGTYKLLTKMKWFILKTDDSVNLPTSDNPVIIAKYRNGKFFIGADQGYSGNDSFVVMPLSPKKVLFGS